MYNQCVQNVSIRATFATIGFTVGKDPVPITLTQRLQIHDVIVDSAIYRLQVSGRTTAAMLAVTPTATRTDDSGP